MQCLPDFQQAKREEEEEVVCQVTNCLSTGDVIKFLHTEDSECSAKSLAITKALCMTPCGHTSKIRSELSEMKGLLLRVDRIVPTFTLTASQQEASHWLMMLTQE